MSVLSCTAAANAAHKSDDSLSVFASGSMPEQALVAGRPAFVVAQAPPAALGPDVVVPPDAVGPAPEPGAPAPRPATPPPASTPAAPGASPSPTPTPTPLPYIENVPFSTLWPKYFDAVKRIQAGDPAGVKELYFSLSSEDVKWFEANYKHLADLLSSGTLTGTPEQLKLFVLQAFLRNMPKSAEKEPKVSQALHKPYAVARVTDHSTGSPVDYETLLIQEGGRWVISHFFFARDFIWMPQLAHFKKLNGIPNSPDETVYLTQGLQPFVEWARGQFLNCGYEREGPRGSSSTPTSGPRR